MVSPKVITLEVSPTKSTLSLEVLEPSDSQTNTNFMIESPTGAMTISTEPVNGTPVPSLIDDATSSEMPSEESLVINPEEDGTNPKRRFRSRRGGKTTNFVYHGHTSHSQSGSSEHDLRLSVSTLSSERVDDGNVEYSTTSNSDSVVKKQPPVTKREHKHHKGHKGRSARKGSISPDESEDSDRTSCTRESTARRTGKKRHSSGRWSESEDAILKSMKDGGETWASITAALDRGKKDVQRRFKELKASKEGGTKTNKSSLKKDTRTGNKSRPPRNSNMKHSRERRKSVPHLSWSSQSTSASPDAESIDSDAQQQIYLQDQIRENLYPPYLSLKDDAHFTKRDCEVLATVDSKMKRGKWLEMQANFFNATGKMVPISVFRDKCEAAEAEERDRIREVKIKSWKAGLDYSVQYDPNESCEVA